MKIKHLLVFALFISCNKEVVYEPAPITPVAVVKTTNDTTTNISIFNYGLSNSANESANGTVYYDNNIIISPGTQEYMSPIHLIKKNNKWGLESASYGKIIDRPRNVYKVSDGTFVWANAGTESETNPTGNLYVSKTNPDNTLTWKKLSDTSKGEFYHFAASGDVNGDGSPDIMSFVGVETESPELFKFFSGPNHTDMKVKFPNDKEFEAALGFTSADRQKVGAGFSFGSFTVANLDSDPKCELILTSTKVLMNEYYSFIILKYYSATNEFKIHKIIPPGGAMKSDKMAVADVKIGDFNGDKINDVVVSLGDYNDNSGIEIWRNDGNGNLVPYNKELYGKSHDKKIFYSNFEVGKFHGTDCIFLHFEGARYSRRPQSDLDLNPFFLISTGENMGFAHPKINLPILKQAPGYVKGYFEKQNGVDALRLIGVRGVSNNEFELIDLTIR